MNENQNNKTSQRDKNKKNANGLLVLLALAVVLTVVFNYLATYIQQTAAATHEINYSEFIDLVKDDKVEEVIFQNGMLEITTVDGFIYTDEDGEEYNEDFTLFTMQVDGYSEDILALLDEHDVVLIVPERIT